MPDTPHEESVRQHDLELVSFGPFRFSPAEGRLTRNGEPVKLGSRAADILRVLIENDGNVVANQDILSKVWSGVFVEDVCLRVHIAALRKALDIGDASFSPVRNVPGRGYAFAAATTRTTVKTTVSVQPLFRLPALPPRTISRDDELAELCAKVAAERLVTIVGAGGMGKTTMALAVGHALLDEYAGAVAFVDLVPVTDSRGLAMALISSFGLRPRTGSPVPELVSLLAARQALLILDNAEHLLSDVSSLCEQLLGALPSLRILVTSREALRAAGEAVHRMRPLRSPEDPPSCTPAEIAAFPAVRLFLDKMANGGAARTPSDAELETIAVICCKLGGVALAIELAAGRVGSFSLKEIAALLDSQIALRWPGRRTAPPHQQTMSATLDWSYDLLEDREKKVLRRLSVFTGGFTLGDVCAVLSEPTFDSETISGAFEGLLAKSLVSAEVGSGTTRYKLPQITRAYCELKLNEAGEQRIFRLQHAQYFRDRIQQEASEGGRGGEPPNVSADMDNIRSALQWALGDDGDLLLGIDLAASSDQLWFERALFAAGSEWTSKASHLLSDAKTKGSRNDLLIQMALATSETADPGYSKERWLNALELATSLKDVRRQMIAYLVLWTQEQRALDYDASLARAIECAEAAKGVSDLGPMAMANWMLGMTRLRMGRLAEARTDLENSIDRDTEGSRQLQIRDTGYDRRVSAIAGMANLLWLQGFPDQAQHWCDRTMDEAKRLGRALPLSVAMTWTGLTRYLFDQDIDAVEQDIVELLEHARARSNKVYEGCGLCLLGLCQTRREDFEAAKPLVEKGLQLLAETGFGVLDTFFRTTLGEAAIKAGRLVHARELLNEIAAKERNAEHWCKPETLRIEGLLAQANGHRKRAEDIFRRSLALAREQGARGWELRTAMDLARSLAGNDRRVEASQLLETVHARFTEGSETLDLVCARRLLNDLAGKMEARA